MQKNEYENIYKNEGTHWYYITTHNLVISLIKQYSQKKKLNMVLDAGCGTGLLIEKMAKFGTVYGIDLSTEAIKFSKKRGIKKIYKGSVTNLPFRNNFFDIVVSIDVLYHKWVKNDLAAIREFHRVLKPEGLLILKLPAFNWLAGKHDQIVNTKQRYTRNDVEKRLHLSEFKVVKTCYFFLSILPFVIFERLIKTEYESDLTTVPTFINHILIKLMNFELNLLKIINLPIGTSVISVSKKLKVDN